MTRVHRLLSNSALPAAANYLPKYAEFFFMKVAKAAHDYKNVDNDKSFDHGKVLDEFRAVLYNTIRNDRSRSANGSEPKIKKAKLVLQRVDDVQTTPESSAAPTSEVTSAPPPDSPDESEPDTDIINIPDSPKDTPTRKKQGASKEKSTGTKESKPASEEEKTPGKLTRSKAMALKKSRLDELVAAAAAGSDVKEVIAGLTQMAAEYRKGRKSRRLVMYCDKVDELVNVLDQLPPSKPWKHILMKYRAALKQI